MLLLVSPSFALAATAIGQLTLEEGSVKLRRAGQDQIIRTLGQKVEIFNGDELQTGAKSRAKLLLLIKKDVVDLYSNSFLNIDKIAGDTRSIRLPIGKAKFKVIPLRKARKVGQRRPFQVRTVNALIGVKGTEFVLSTGAEQTNLLTLDGAVSMANVATPEVEVEVGQNQASQITKTAAPTQPVQVSPQAVQSILTSESPQAWSAVKFGTPVVDQPTKKKSEKPTEKKGTGKKLEEKKEPAKESGKGPAKGVGPVKKGAPGLAPDGDPEKGGPEGPASGGEEEPEAKPAGEENLLGEPEGGEGNLLSVDTEDSGADAEFSAVGGFAEIEEPGFEDIVVDDILADVPIDDIVEQIGAVEEIITEQVDTPSQTPIRIQVNH